MKKLIVLAMLLMAVTLWAQDLTVGGTISYIGAWDAKQYSDQPRYELKFNWVVDDYNTAYLEFEEGPMTPGFGTGAVGANGAGTTTADAGYAPGTAAPLPDKAWVMTDVGKALGLPIGVTMKFGLEEWNNVDSIKVTKTEWENFLGERDFRTWGAQVEVMPADIITLRAQWAWNVNPQYFMVGAYGTIDPVSYEVTYFTNGKDSLDLGWIEGGVEAGQDVAEGINVSVAVMGEVDLQNKPQYRLQAGAQVLLNSMASLGLAWRGQEDAMAGGLQVQAWAMPLEDQPLELLVVAGLGLDDSLYPDTFDSLEAGVKYSIGKMSYYVGYYYAVEGTGNIAKEWLDETVYGTATSDTNAIWIRGILAF
jgi:hypothetical protein